MWLKTSVLMISEWPLCYPGWRNFKLKLS